MTTFSKFSMIFLFMFAQLFLATISLSKEAEATFVDIEGHSLKNAEETKLACDLLGVQFNAHYIRTKNSSEILKSITELQAKEVLILTERSLKYFKKNLVSIVGKSDRKTKILILDIKPETDIETLKIWSENKIRNFRQFYLPQLPTLIRVVKNDQVSKELGGMEYNFIGNGSGVINGFESADSVDAVSLIEAIDESGEPVCPIFLKTSSAKKSVFFLSSWNQVFSSGTNGLIKIIPILMFLKYSFGDRCWHGINDYANFTIDDPWLREPYGYLRYTDLSKDAKEIPFHVTISFIPFNYKKSQKNVIALFRQYQKNMSIAIHGNNHDHSEFRSRKNARLTDNKSSAVHPDEKNILQALYRMNTFRHETGIPYDRVMIFPRGVFTKESLGLLKKHNFLMTVNSTLPLYTENIASRMDQLRGITLQFENFPMVLRTRISNSEDDKHAAAGEKNLIQMRLFLDLPVLLYTHHGFFKKGTHSLNSIAETINKLQPDVVWSGLGGIAGRLYLQKKINDREMEVLAYSSDIVIKNNYHSTMKYIVRKQEDFLIPIESVEVNGTRRNYEKEDNNIRIEVLIESGNEKNIRIIYRSDYQVGSFTYSDQNFRVNLTRTLSDFRDIYLSKLPFGDIIVTLFNEIGGKVVIYLLGLTGIISIVFFLRINNTKKKKVTVGMHDRR